jgi:hypothetical protein
MRQLATTLSVLVLFGVAATVDAAAATNAIAFGQITSATISPARQTNCYSFNAASNDIVAITLLRTNGTGATHLYFYDPIGNLIYNSGGSGALVHDPGIRLVQAGTYVICVIEAGLDGAYSYLLRISKVACGVNLQESGDGPEMILAGQITGGTLTAADYDTYCFTASSNDVLYLTMLRTNGPGVNPYLYLYDPDGILVAGLDRNDYVAYFDHVRLTRTGTYIVAAIDDGLNESFGYRITFNLASCGVNLREPQDGPEALVAGQISGGTLTGGDYDTYCFTASSNDVLYLTMLRTNGPGVNPYLYLYDPDGILVAGLDRNDYVAYFDHVRLTRTGTYIVAAIDDGLNESFGYRITFNLGSCGVNLREPEDGPETLVAGQISGGTLTGADYDTYCFSASSNDVLYLTMLRTNGPGTYPVLYLYDPDGVRVAGLDRNDYVAYFENVRLTRTGTYIVAAIDDGLNESFGYRITFNLANSGVNLREPEDGAETLVAGQISGGTLVLADYDTYRFTASSNDVLYLTMLRTNGPGSYPYFYVYDPDGTVLAGPDYNDYLAHIHNRRLTKSGTYTVGVLDNGLNESFGYRITFNIASCGVNLRQTEDGAETLVAGQISGGTLVPADYDTYCFTASSNDVLYLTMLRTNGPGSYPYFYVYDPDGIVLAGPDYNDYLAHIYNRRLTKSGTYTVGVLDNGLNESFGYRITFNIASCGVNLRQPEDGAETLVAGQISGGTLVPADYDTYCFTASSNDVLYLTMLRTNGPGSYPYFYVYAPDGTVLDGPDYNDHLAHIYNRRLTKSGTYTVGVLDNGLNESFGYSVCMIKIPGPNFPEIGEGAEILLSGETRAARITLGDSDAFAFRGIAGDSILLTGRRTSGSGRPALVLHGPDGTILASDSDPSSARIRASCVGQTGTYVVIVQDSSLNQSFDYILSLVQSPGPPPTNAPPEYLQAFSCSNLVVLRWQTEAIGFQLQYIDRLDYPIRGLELPYVNIAGPYPAFSGFHYVTNPATSDNTFFRLVKP